MLTISYDGSGFFGWQRQPDRMTVQGHLESVMSSVFKRPIVLNGTSRTDAGVHALGQRASFKADIGIPVERIPRVVNNALSGREKGSFAISPIRIVAAEEMPADFHARFDAKGKKYIYRIKNTGFVDLFNRNYVYHVDRPLDISAMKKAAEDLKGTHDFKSFESAGGNPRETTVRTIFDAAVSAARKLPDEMREGFAGDVEIHVSGDGFLYNMVRIITGTLVDIGTGKIASGEMRSIIERRERAAAGHTAPPYGLYLAEVYYN